MTYVRTHKRASSRLGFSLVELMIALIAGSFAIAGAYYLGGVSSRAFNEQMRVGETQMSLRSAMEQMRRDFGRAAYMGVRNISELPECPLDPGNRVQPSGATIQGLRIEADGSMAGVAALLDTANNPTRVDRVNLWGNYATSDAYLIAADEDVNKVRIGFETTGESFRRSFVDPAYGGNPETFNVARFNATFAAERWVRVEHDSRYYFRKIAAPSGNVTPSNSFLTLESPLPGCFQYMGARRAMVSPFTRVEYAVVPVEGEIARLAATAAGGGPGSERAVLVRREVNIETDDVVPNSTRVVLDYAVEFAVDGIVNTAPAGSTPTFAYATPGGTVDLDTASTTTPESFRSLRVTLSARTPEADPRIGRMPRPNLTTPFMSFRVPGLGTSELWARVRTLRAEIFLPNMMAEP